MRPYTSNRTRVSRLPLRTLAHSLNQTSFGASEIIRNMCFVLVFWPVLNSERLFLYHFHVEGRPAGNLLVPSRWIIWWNYIYTNLLVQGLVYMGQLGLSGSGSQTELLCYSEIRVIIEGAHQKHYSSDKP